MQWSSRNSWVIQGRFWGVAKIVGAFSEILRGPEDIKRDSKRESQTFYSIYSRIIVMLRGSTIFSYQGLREIEGGSEMYMHEFSRDSQRLQRNSQVSRGTHSRSLLSTFARTKT
jgi:hypothetical protein